MKYIQFQYTKTPTDVTDRKAVVLSEPSNNFFTIDITEFNDEELGELEAGLLLIQSNIDKAFAARTTWLREQGFGSYFRNFNKDKMTKIIR
jgi:hypothetical protein